MKLEVGVGMLLLACAAFATAQKLTVKIVDRQDKEDSYDYAAVYNNIAWGKLSKYTERHSHFNYLTAGLQWSIVKASLRSIWPDERGIIAVAVRL